MTRLSALLLFLYLSGCAGGAPDIAAIKRYSCQAARAVCAACESAGGEQ